MKKVLELHIILDKSYTVESKACKIDMVLFHGECYSDFFNGTILPGGVDTQTCKLGSHKLLSARYMIDGVDEEGTRTKLFIENNGFAEENGATLTHPVIYTDNKRLQWLEEMPLIGKFVERGEEFWIEFLEK